MRAPALLAAILGLLAPASAAPQSSTGPAPRVIFRFDPEYQAAVSTGGGDPADEVRWAERRAEDLTDFYASSGNELLGLLSDYAGLRWPYAEIDAYVLRYFPTLSIQYPLTFVVGAIRRGGSNQEVPSGDFLILTFAHQITHYLLDPPPAELDAARPVFLDRHPLMQEGNYRREALINLVAYRALRDLWGAERLRKVVRQPLWESYNPEAAFIDSLATRWDLSRERPLVSRLQSEGEEGEMVALAERFERAGRQPPEGTPQPGAPAAPVAPGTLSGNDFGFDLGQTAEGRLFIAYLDPGSPADSAGLHSGDAVVTVEGRRFTSVAEAMRAVRDAWEASREVNLSVDRGGREVFFQIH
jgi:hypothetical protein